MRFIKRSLVLLLAVTFVIMSALPVAASQATSYTYTLDDDSEMGFDIILSGEYKKLKMTLSDSTRKATKQITVGKADKDFSSAGTIGRYSEKVIRNLKNYGVGQYLGLLQLW